MAARIIPEYLTKEELKYEVAIRIDSSEETEDMTVEELRKTFREHIKEKELGDARLYDPTEELEDIEGFFRESRLSIDGRKPRTKITY